MANFPSHSKEARKREYRVQKERYQDYALRKRYGITKDERDAMFQSQGGRCAACGREMELGHNKDNAAHVDHDHATGKVRSLLCNRCNRVIGECGESAGVLKSLIRYLGLWQTSQ